MIHEVSEGADGLQVVTLVRSADVLELGEGFPEQRDEGVDGVDGGAGLLEQSSDLAVDLEGPRGGQGVHQHSEATKRPAGLIWSRLAD